MNLHIFESAMNIFYYTVEESGDVLVWRILDLRRDPRKIAQALK